jgi:hypothetical protein
LPIPFSHQYFTRLKQNINIHLWLKNDMIKIDDQGTDQ